MKKQFLFLASILIGYVCFSQNVVYLGGVRVNGITDNPSPDSMQHNRLVTENAVRQMIQNSAIGSHLNGITNTQGDLVSTNWAIDENGNVTEKSLIIDLDNTNYNTPNGTNSHLLLTNENEYGQNSVTSTINGNLSGKWRSDYVGNLNWVSYTTDPTSGHYFFVGGDYGEGTIQEVITNSGVRIGNNLEPYVYPNYTLDITGTLGITGAFSTDNGAITSNGNGILSVSDGQYGYDEAANKTWVENQGFLYNSPYDGSVYYATVAGNLDDGNIYSDGYGILYATGFVGQFGGYIAGGLPFEGGGSEMWLEYLNYGGDPLISFSGTSGWGFYFDPSNTDFYSYNVYKMPNHSGTFALSVNGVNTDVTNGNINIKDGLNKTRFTPATGGSITLTNNAYNIVAPNSTLAALTVSFPSSPSDGDVVEIKFTKAVTTVTYSGTVADPITSPTVGMLVKYKYDSQTSQWF